MAQLPSLAALSGCSLPLLLFHLLLLASTATTTTSPPTVQCPWGRLVGKRLSTPVGAVDGYLGVPFALPPTGQRRWEKPQPHPGPGEGQVYEATAFQASCAQEVPSLLLYNESNISEDCLYLNVFVPAVDERDELRPVMVWIHGGGFFIGDAPVYQPYKLVGQGDVIVVTIQYRLGALGFLSTGDDTLPGNYGLWDQQLALKWVKDNIRSFGGDPDTITIFGESAGGMSVGLQALSPKSKGLFRRAILQSGSPTVIGQGRWVRDAQFLFSDLAASLNCASPDKVKVIECLRAVPADVLANTDLVRLTTFQETDPFRVNVGPRVDGDFLPDDPARLVEDAEYVHRLGLDQVDVLVGFNNNEGALAIMAAAMLPDGLARVQSRPYLEKLLQDTLLYHTAGRHSPEAEQVVHFFYRRAKSFGNEPTEIKTLTDMFGDSLFYVPSIFWLRSLVRSQSTGKRYLYLFDHDFAFNRHTMAPGTHHGEELALEFDPAPLENSLYFKMQNKTYDGVEDAPALSDIFVKVVTGFAKSGNPGQGLVSDLLESEWPEYQNDEAYVALTTKPQVRHRVYEDRMALWLQLLPLFVSNSPPAGTAESTFRKEEL